MRGEGCGRNTVIRDVSVHSSPRDRNTMSRREKYHPPQSVCRVVLESIERCVVLCGVSNCLRTELANAVHGNITNKQARPKTWTPAATGI